MRLFLGDFTNLRKAPTGRSRFTPGLHSWKTWRKL